MRNIPLIVVVLFLVLSTGTIYRHEAGLKAASGEDVANPFIESVTPQIARVGDVLQLVGRGFAGFEGDLDAWIENDKGEVAYLQPTLESLYIDGKYKQIVSGKEVIRVQLESRACHVNNSYSGLDCESYMEIVPGKYKIFTRPWSVMSNKIEIQVISAPLKTYRNEQIGFEMTLSGGWNVEGEAEGSLLISRETGESGGLHGPRIDYVLIAPGACAESAWKLVSNDIDTSPQRDSCTLGQKGYRIVSRIVRPETQSEVDGMLASIKLLD